MAVGCWRCRILERLLSRFMSVTIVVAVNVGEACGADFLNGMVGISPYLVIGKSSYSGLLRTRSIESASPSAPLSTAAQREATLLVVPAVPVESILSRPKRTPIGGSPPLLFEFATLSHENYNFLHLSAKLLAPFVLICFFRCIMALFQMKMKNERFSKQSNTMTLAGLTYLGYP